MNTERGLWGDENPQRHPASPRGRLSSGRTMGVWLLVDLYLLCEFSSRYIEVLMPVVAFPTGCSEHSASLPCKFCLSSFFSQ